MADSEKELEQLENALIRAGKSITYPATPPLAARVRAGLQVAPRRALSLPRWAVVIATAIIVAIGLLIAFPAARDVLAQILGLRTVRIIFVTPTPTPTITATPNPSVTPAATPLPTLTPTPRAQCCETTLADARARTQFKILLPPSESPTRVYLQNLPNFGNAQQIILVVGDPSAPRFTLYEATNFLYGKMVSGGTIIEETQVKGQRALWLSGAPHLLVYLDAKSQPQFEGERTVSANTLAWEIGDVTYRIETTTSKEEAIRFAESLQ